jgi:uncharacterized membrane protein
MPDSMVVVSRCLHVLGAIALLGGAIFIRYLLTPAADRLPESERDTFRGDITKRWKPWVHAGITVLILTGFYNYLAVMLPLHKGDKQYHMLMGIKILLAMVVFFIASVLPGRVAAFATMRKNSKTWLTVSILCAIAVVCIAGYLKVRGVPANVPHPAVTPPAAPPVPPDAGDSPIPQEAGSTTN